MAFGDRNPEQIRAWQERARQRARRRADQTRRALASSELVPTRPRPAKTRFPTQPKRSPAKPATTLPPDVQRSARARSGGKCVMCLWLISNGLTDRKMPRKIAHLHHVLPKGLSRFSKWRAESANLIGLCYDCHMAHETAAVERTADGGLRSRRVPWEALPDVVVGFIARGGGPAIDYAGTHYPRAQPVGGGRSEHRDNT